MIRIEIDQKSMTFFVVVDKFYISQLLRLSSRNCVYLLMVILWMMLITRNNAIRWIITFGWICTRRISIANVSAQIQRFWTRCTRTIIMIMYIA